MKYLVNLRDRDEALFNSLKAAFPFKISNTDLFRLSVKAFGLLVQKELSVDTEYLREIQAAIRIIKGESDDNQHERDVSREDALSLIENYDGTQSTDLTATDPSEERGANTYDACFGATA